MNRLRAYLLAGLLLLAAVPLIAQDQMSEAEQRDWLVEFVEGQLSTPERQIRLSNIEGLLSEDASIREVTISDTEGVWLRVTDAAINWNQGALFTSRLEIRTLSAGLIEVIRNPVPSEAVDLPAPEAGGLAVPELPVAVILGRLSVPKVTFGESVFGLGSEISVAGGLVLEGGNLDANLEITRLDGPGGRLSAAANYRREGQTIDVDVTLTEPEDGIIANLLNIAERPPIALAVKGSGPVADLRTEMTLDAGEVRALGGVATITQAAEGFRIAADLRGPIAELMAEPYRRFFGAETALSANALVRQEGGVSISELKLGGGQLSVEGAAETTADGFLRRLDLNAFIADPAGGDVTLPLPGEPTTVNSARVTVSYGADQGGTWAGTLAVGRLDAGGIAADAVTLNASGAAVDLDDPAKRRVTFNSDGAVTGIDAESAEVQAALGESIGLGAAGLWNAGEPLELAELRLEGKALSMVLAGAMEDFVFDGAATIQASSIAPFSGVAGRTLAGALDLRAEGTVSPLLGGFDLTLDGTGTDLRVGEDALDAILKGDVQLSGRLARTEAGIEAEGFRLTNEQLTLAADGRFASTAADFDFRLDLDDLSLLSDEASGALSVIGSATGTDGPVDVDLTVNVPQGRLVGRPLRDAATTLAGTIADGAFDGTLIGAALLDGQPVSLSAGLASSDEQRRLSDLLFEAAGARVIGDIAQGADGALSGEVEIDAPDISTAAALVLIDATGSIRGSAQIAGTAEAPRGTFTISGSGINAAEIRPYAVAPVSFEAGGSFADNAVQLQTLNANGAGGLRLAASGAIPVTGSGLALTVTGSAPLALGSQFVAERGGQLRGTAALDARMTGALSDPRITGRISTSDGGYIDPELGLRLQGLSGSASLAGDRIVIDSLGASLATGGTLSVSGSVALAAPNAADLRLRLDSARYVDAELLVATVSGQLALTGSLARNPLLSGDILVEEANIIVPETFGGGAALIEVEHIWPAPAVQATLARARLQQGGLHQPPGLRCCSSMSICAHPTRSSFADAGSMPRWAGRCGCVGRSAAFSRSAAFPCAAAACRSSDSASPSKPAG